METEVQSKFTYMGRTFTSLSINESSSAFSDCNSDRSGEFPTASSESRRLFLACASENSDELIHQLVSDLESSSIDEQKQAVIEIRLLAKNKPENRIKIARAGAIKPLISLISSTDPQLQENGVTAILNLSLCDENKELIAASGAIKPLVRALKVGTSTARENAACALLRLSQVEENKIAIGRSGAIPPLVNLLETGNFRGKKDASTALYTLCSVKENKVRAVQAGVMKPLVELMADFSSNMVDKSAFVVSELISVAEARPALVDEGGIPVLVEIVVSATELLQNQLTRHSNHQQPHHQQQQNHEWFGNRQGVVVGGSLQIPFEDANVKDHVNARVLSNRDSVTADYYQRQHNQVSSINIDTAESMQLFLMNNPQPSSPSKASSQPTTSTLHQGFPNPVGGHFGQFICGGANLNIEGQGLSLSLSSTLQHLEAAKVEELRLSRGGEMLFFDQESQNHHHVGFGSSLGLVNVLRNSKYAKATQELLEEFCSVVKGQLFKKISKVSGNNNNTTSSPSINPSGSNNNASSSKDIIPHNLSSADRLDHQRRKVKLLSMLDEVDKRYNHYCEQMQMVVNSFDLVMGLGAAVPYTALAQKAMSRHFKCLKDGVKAQLNKTCEVLGEKDAAASSSWGLTKGETPRLKALEQSLRQQRVFQQMGMMEQEAWRPQRGLPERSVNILRAWLFEHFLHPYPSDADKHLLARQTSLSRNQVANWFINARVRLWKPMIEEMYKREVDGDENSNAQTPYITTSSNLTETKSSAIASDKKSRINAPEDDPSIVAMNSHYSSSMPTCLTNFTTIQDESDHILSRREIVSGGEYEGTTNISEIGSNMIAFGTNSAGDVSLTLGLRHAGNLPENTHFFG